MSPKVTDRPAVQLSPTCDYREIVDEADEREGGDALDRNSEHGNDDETDPDVNRVDRQESEPRGGHKIAAAPDPRWVPPRDQ